MRSLLKKILYVFGGLVLALLLAFAVLWFGASTWPAEKVEEVSCTGDPPELQPGQKLRVLNWNIQYLAGKNYVFFYDLPDGSGPHERPSPADIASTAKEVARIIEVEKPDLVLLQEVDDGAKRTDKSDQTQLIVEHLRTAYPCRAESFYWKALFVPHPRIMGSAGMKLVTLSRYRLKSAVRYGLPPIPADPLTQRLGLHRAVLDARVEMHGDKELSVLNTHLDAFAQGTDIMDRQVKLVAGLLEKRDQAGIPWILGGDFNLLPPGFGLEQLELPARPYYNTRSEIEPLFEKFQSTATKEMLNGPGRAAYFTINPNNPAIKHKPDRTIDYIFYSKQLKLRAFNVRKQDTMHISDHLPLIAEFAAPN